MPAASSVPKGNIIRAAQIESRPKSVRYQGVPAAAKMSSGSSGSVRSRWRRSSIEVCTVDSRRGSCALTLIRDQSTLPEPGSASKLEAVTRRTSTTTVTVAARPWATSRVKLTSAGESPWPGSTRVGAGSKQIVVSCRSSAQDRPPPSGDRHAVIGTPPASPDLTAPMSAPSPARCRTRSARMGRSARETTWILSRNPPLTISRCRCTSTVGSAPPFPRWRAEPQNSDRAPTLADAMKVEGSSPSRALNMLRTRRSSTKNPCAPSGSI